MKSEILDYVKKIDTVSFVELSNSIPGFKGDSAIHLASHPSIVLWSGLSDDAVKAISELLGDGELFITPTSSMTYLIDGEAIKLPIAKSFRDYKHPRWLPVVFTHNKPK